jgi:tetratricopeptide (TPR) repeat protein
MGFKIVKQTTTEVEDRDPNLYVRRAEDSLRKRHYSEALTEMDKAINFAPQNKKNGYLFEKIKIYEAIGKDSTSIGFIKKHIGTFYHYLSLSDFYRVLAAFQKNVAHNGNELVGVLQANRIPAVLALTYQNSSDTSRSYFIHCAEYYMNNRQFIYALECLTVIVSKYGEDVDSVLSKARILRAQGKFNEALTEYTNAANFPKATVMVYQEIIHLLRQLGRSDAIRWAEAGLKRFTNHRDLLHLKAELLHLEGNYDACLETVEIILEYHPTDEKAIYYKGLAFDQKGKFFRANRYLRKANKLSGKYLIPKNNLRERFIFRVKFFVFSLIVLAVLFVGGQYVLFKTGMIKPFIYNSNINLPSEKIFVKQTVELDKSISYFPVYSKKPNVRVVIDDPKILKLNLNGDLEGLKEGTSKIKLVWDKKVLESIKIQIVEPKVVQLKASLMQGQLEVGEFTTLSTGMKMDYEKAEKPKLEYSSNNPSVAVVDKKGRVEAIGIGWADITVSVGQIRDTKKILIKPNVNVTLQSKDISLEIGNKLALKPTVTTTPPNEAITLIYSTNDSAVATVDPSGEIEAVGYGKTVIKISSSGRVKESVNVLVKPKKVINLRAEFDQETMKLHLMWDYDAPENERISFEVEGTKDGEAIELSAGTLLEANVNDVEYNSRFQFTVNAIVNGIKSDSKTLVYRVPREAIDKTPAQNTEVVNDEGPEDEKKNNLEEEKRKAEEKKQVEQLAKITNLLKTLVGYWKRSDDVIYHQPTDDNYRWMKGISNEEGTYFRLDLQEVSYQAGYVDLSPRDIKVKSNTIFNHELAVTDIFELTFINKNRIRLVVGDIPDRYDDYREQEVFTYEFIRVDISEVPKEFQ